VRHALYLPPFGELSDARALAELAVEAEARGWDGMFLWDHILRPADEPQELADVGIALAAVAMVTSRLRLGPMVTPTIRRRPQKLAREALTLDHLSAGRLTVGLGLGVDTSGELSRFGEVTDPRQRGDALDEAADLLAELWSGVRVDHRGPYYQATDVQLLPLSVQRPRIPMWFAARGDARRPVRRAARFDGLFAIEVDLDGFIAMMAIIEEERGGRVGFDAAVLATPGADLARLEDAGATWAMWGFRPGATVAEVRRRVETGPSMAGPRG